MSSSHNRNNHLKRKSKEGYRSQENPSKEAYLHNSKENDDDSGCVIHVHIGQDNTISLNPVPDDLKCNICGTHISELEPFEEEVCKFREELPKLLGTFPMTSFITPDHKLVKTFRSFIDGCIEASWECVNCYEGDHFKSAVAHFRQWQAN